MLLCCPTRREFVRAAHEISFSSHTTPSVISGFPFKRAPLDLVINNVASSMNCQTSCSFASCTPRICSGVVLLILFQPACILFLSVGKVIYVSRCGTSCSSKSFAFECHGGLPLPQLHPSDGSLSAILKRRGRHGPHPTEKQNAMLPPGL